MKLSSRMQVIKPSPTMAVVGAAAALRAQGIDVVSFGAGEPDFDTPEHIKEAAREAMRRGQTKYTPVEGTADVRAAIVEKLARENDLPGYSAKDQVCVACGGKHALFNAFLALLDAGDEVVIPAPYWVSYPEMVAVAGGSPVIVPTTEASGFKMRPDDLAAAIGPRTRAVVLNSPSNPAGVVYATAELRALADVVRPTNVIVVSDDIYEHILYVDPPRHLGAVAPELRDRLLVVNSLSKTYAMTGWRLGYAAGPADLIAAMVTLQGQSTSNATSIVQAAAAVALRGPQDAVVTMVAEFRRRRALVLDRIRALPELRCVPPDGAFYVFVDVSAIIGRSWAEGVIRNGDDVARFLLATGHVATVGGGGFGSERHIRVSFAVSAAQLNEGFDRIARALAQLR